MPCLPSLPSGTLRLIMPWAGPLNWAMGNGQHAHQSTALQLDSRRCRRAASLCQHAWRPRGSRAGRSRPAVGRAASPGRCCRTPAHPARGSAQWSPSPAHIGVGSEREDCKTAAQPAIPPSTLALNSSGLWGKVRRPAGAGGGARPSSAAARSSCGVASSASPRSAWNSSVALGCAPRAAGGRALRAPCPARGPGCWSWRQ